MGEIEAYSYWMKQLVNRSEGTKTKYKSALKKFLKWIDKTPNELIELQKKSLNALNVDPRENQVLETQIKTYMHVLEEEGYSTSYRRLNYSAIRSFFDLNMFPLRLKPQDRPQGDSYGGSRIPEKSEIRAMLNEAKSKGTRACILALKDSGLRISDLLQLKWEDIHDFGDGFWGFTILTKKRKVRATPFLGEESTDAIKRLERKSEFIFPKANSTLLITLSRLLRGAKLKGITGHGLRKFFNAELEGARVPREYRYMMMGKKIAGSEYDEKRLRVLFEAYRKAYDQLRVFGSQITDERLNKLEVENKELRNLIDEKEKAIQTLMNYNKILAERLDKLDSKFEESILRGLSARRIEE